MTGSTLATAALWSYGLAAVGYAAFAIRLALGWHRSLRATLLLAAIVATALWAGAGMALGDGGLRTLWLVSNTLDTLRYACWFAFVASLLAGSAGHDPAEWRGTGARWPRS